MHLEPLKPYRAPRRIPRWCLLLGVLFAIGLFVVGSAMSRFAQAVQVYAIKAENPELPADVSPNEAIVVLTGDRYRIPKAIDLLRIRQSPLLIISGAGKGATLTDLVNQQGGAAANIHETWKKIVVESNSVSTIENARESGKILKPKGIHRIILVTSEYHMRRASEIFHRVLPSMEIIDYPIASDVSKISTEISERTFTGVLFFWIEFWKTILYRFYSSRQVVPLP